MADRIATGEIYVDLNDGGAHSKLARLQAAYHRAMAAIDAEEATATVDADLSKFDRKIKKARADLERLEREEATVDFDGNAKPLQEALARARAELAAFEKQKPQVHLDAESARLKDEIAQAKAALKALDHSTAQAKLGLDDEEFDAKRKTVARKLRDLESESAVVDVRLAGYAKTRKQIADLEKAISDLAATQVKAAQARAKAEENLAEAEADRAKAVEAHEERVLQARQKAADKRRALEERANAQLDALEEQQYRKTIQRLKRESKTRAEFARYEEQTYRGLQRLRDMYDRGGEFAYKGVRGNYMRQLAQLDDARRRAADNAQELQKIEEKEIVLREKLARVTRTLTQFERFRAEDDRIQRELDEVPKLEAAYNRLIRKMEGLDRAHRKATLQRDHAKVFDIELDARDLTRQIDNMREEIRRRVGRDPIVFDADAKMSTRAGARLRHNFIQSLGNPGDVLVRSMHDAGGVAGTRAGRIFQERFRREVNGGRGLKGNVKDVGALGAGAVLRGVDVFRKFGEGISSATVRVGPFTMTVRKAAGAIALLSPILVDVVGALGSLVGVAGSALVGVGALGVGLIGGAIPAFLGMGFVIKDVVQEFAAVKKATKAYDDAVLKHGKTSDQAAKKQKELQQVMGGVSKTTADQVKLAQSLGDRWDKATKPGRASVWKAIGEGIKSASDLLPMFAKNTNETLNTAERGVSRWARALRSSMGKAVINTMMDNFNASLGPALAGLGQFVAYLGKVGAVASQSLPGLSNTFNRWAKGLNESTNESKRFVGGIHGVINSAKDVGNVFLSAGRLTKSFFGAGVRDGQKFSQTLSRTMDRWTAGFNTPQGRRELQDFFREAIDGTKSLYHFMAPIASTFVGWARALSPIARAFFDGAAAVARFVQAIAEATAMQGPLAALAATLGTLWALGKIGGAAAAVGRFVSALFGVRAAGTAAAAAQARLGAAGAATARGAAGPNALAASNARVAQTAAAAAAAQARLAAAGGASFVGARNAARGAERRAAAPPVIVPPGGARQVGAVGGASGRAANAVRGLGTAVLGTTGMLGGLVVAAAAAGVGLYAYMNRTRQSEKDTKAMADATKRTDQALAASASTSMQLAGAVVQRSQANRDLASTEKAVAATRRQLNALDRAGKKGSQEYKDTQAQLTQQTLQLKSAQLAATDARRQVLASQREEKRNIQEIGAASTEQYNKAKSAVKNFRDENKGSIEDYAKIREEARRSGKSEEEAMRALTARNGRMHNDAIEKGREFQRLKDTQTAAERRFQDAQAKGALAHSNLKREMQGMAPIAQSHARMWASLGAQAGGYGRKIQNVLTSSQKYIDPSKAASAAKAANAALKSGVSGRQVLKIVADSSSAEQAIRRLNNARIKTLVQKIRTEGADDARRALNDLVGAELAPKVIKILAQDGSAKSKIAALVALGIPPKTAQLLARDLGTPVVNKLKGTVSSVQGKTVSVNATVGGQGAVEGLKASIAGVVSKTVTVAVNTVKRVIGGGKAAGGTSFSAAGRDPETPATQNAQDRAFDRMNRGMLPRLSTTQAQMGGKVSGPRAVWGEEPAYPEFVLSSNPSYRKRNIGFLRQAAQALGVEMAATGAQKKNRKKPASTAQITKATNQARATFGKKGKKGKPIAYQTENLLQLPKVEAAKRAEDNFREQIGREAEQLDKEEPTSFLRNTGEKSPNGDPIMAIDEEKIAKWNQKLVNFANRVQQLIDLINKTLAAVMAAMTEIGDPTTKKGGVIGASQTNIETLQSLIGKENQTKKKAKSNAAKQMASARIKWYESQLSDQKGVQTSAIADWKMLDDERNDIGDATRGRMAEALDNKATYMADAGVDGVQSKASASASDALASDPGANYKPDTPQPGAELQTKLSDLDTESQLADLGQGYKGKPVRTKEQINADRAATGQAMIDKGNSLLTDNDPTNDDEGRNLIGSGAGVLSDLANGSTSPNALQAAFNGANAARDELYKQFGSNVISHGGTVADLMKTGLSKTLRGSGPQGSGNGDTYVTLSPTFREQPSDPHLWSRDVAFELAAAI
jgi:hypothetical protein